MDAQIIKSYRAKLKRNNRFRAQISSTSSQDTSDDEIQQLEGSNGTYKDWHHENLAFYSVRSS